MKGFLIVDLPSSCCDCRYFRSILSEPLVLNFSDKEPEYIGSACTCTLTPGHRLKPIDRGIVMEQIVHPSFQEGMPPNTEAYMHNGRPSWCPIREKGVSFFESQNVEQGNSSQGVFNSSQREERSN